MISVLVPEPPAPAPPSASRFALAVLLLLPLGLVAQAASRLPGLLATELVVFLLPVAVAVRAGRLDPSTWLRLRPPGWRAGLQAAAAGTAGFVLATALHAATQAIAPADLPGRLDLERLFDGPPWERLGLLAVASVVAPVCEELAFRGHLAAALHARHRPAVAITGSAILFALVHLDPVRAPALLLLGLLYGWLAWRSGSVWTAVVAHAVNNAIAAGLLLAG